MKLGGLVIIHLSIYISYVSTYFFIYLYLSTSTPLSIYLSVCLSVCLSIYLSIYLFIYLNIIKYLSKYLSKYLPTYLSIYLSTYLSKYLSKYLCKYLSKYLSISRTWWLVGILYTTKVRIMVLTLSGRRWRYIIRYPTYFVLLNVTGRRCQFWKAYILRHVYTIWWVCVGMFILLSIRRSFI